MDKAAFVTALGGAATVVGSAVNFTTTFASDDVNLTAHGKVTGDGPYHLTTTTTLPAGLTAATNYWVIFVDANTFKLATSKANAEAGTAVTITDNGTGTHSISGVAQGLGDALDDILMEHLTFPGNRAMPKALNEEKFWSKATNFLF